MNYLGSLQAGIICLQDTHWTDSDIRVIKQVWNGELYIKGEKSNSRGVAILIKGNFEYKVLSSFNSDIGNLIGVNLALGELTMKLINIYGPNIDSPSFCANLHDLILTCEQDYVIICGDLNLALDPSMDTNNYNFVNNPKSRATLLNTIESCNLTDIYRYFHPLTKRYTWHRKKPFQQARLDYIITSNNFVDLVEKCNIKPGYRTDHSIVELDIQLCKFAREKGIWNFNCALLKDQEYFEMVNSLINQIKAENCALVYNFDNLPNISDQDLCVRVPHSQFLEILLLQIRGETVKYGTRMKRNRNKKKLQMMSDIENLEKFENLCNMNILEAKQRELQELREERIKGSLVRSRVQWLVEGEKPSKYFCSLEQRVIKPNGKICMEQKEIVFEVKEFYKKLFKNNDDSLTEPDFNNSNFKSNVRKLSASESNGIEGLLTINEIGESLKK